MRRLSQRDHAIATHLNEHESNSSSRSAHEDGITLFDGVALLDEGSSSEGYRTHTNPVLGLDTLGERGSLPSWGSNVFRKSRSDRRPDPLAYFELA